VDDQREGRREEPYTWVPPDAGADRDAAVGRESRPWSSEPGLEEVSDGPPPPPWERQRRTRRHWLIAVAVAAVLAIPIGLAVASVLGTGSEETARDEQADARDPDSSPPGSDEGADDGRSLDAPDLDRLEGPDAIFAQLLLHIDASEQAMLAFQRDLAQVFQAHGFDDDLDQLFEAVAAVGAEGADRLDAARDALEGSVEDVRAEEVRETYLEHLDSWLRYMRAVEADPTILGPAQDDSDRFTLSINTTADAFARSLEDQLPDDADPEVQRMAEQLLDRGFRPQGDADV
jgi:hypothetical protein